MYRFENLIKALLAFNPSKEYVDSVLREVEHLGIETFEDYGEILLHTGVHVVGKGQNSIVMICRVDGREYACKILRPDASRTSLKHEAEILKKANEVNVGPKVVKYGDKIIIMEYVDGIPLEEYVKNVDKDSIIETILKILEQTYRLDNVGIEHSELSRVEEHVLVKKDGDVCIIDFESAKDRSKKISKNTTQIINALIFRNTETCKIIRRLLNIDDHKLKTILEILREYKKRPDRDIFNKLIMTLMSKV